MAYSCIVQSKKQKKNQSTFSTEWVIILNNIVNMRAKDDSKIQKNNALQSSSQPGNNTAAGETVKDAS